jgi:hypothetical protein
MQMWPRDPWALFSRKAGVVYAFCILVALAVYAHSYRIAPVAGTVSLLIVGIVTAAFLLLAGTSGNTWCDPSNVLALFLIASAFLLDGFFIAGAATFGPVRAWDVGVTDWPRDRDDTYFWDEQWHRTKLPESMSEQEYKTFQAWAGNLDLTNDLGARPGRILISLWDRQVWRVTIKNWNPPTTFGESPHLRSRCVIELFFGVLLSIIAFRIWREGRRRGVRYRKHPSLLKHSSIP